MTDAWHSLKLKRFERIDAAPTVALLRISGKGPRRTSAIGDRPRLAADDGQAVRRFVPIPAPADTDRGLLRAAYSVPLRIISERTVFSLEFADGAVISLPAPTPGEARLPGARTDTPRPTHPDIPDPDPPRVGDEERRDELLLKLAELTGDLGEAERSQAQAEAARSAAEADAETARTESRERAERVAQLESAAATAEEIRASLQARAEAGEQRALKAEERLEAAGLELLAAREMSEGVEALRQRNAELEATAARHQEIVRGLELDLIAARESVAPMQMEIETLRTTRALKERELHDALDSVRKMTIERDELSRQAAAFDAVAIKARERATQAEAAAAQSTSVLDELQTWRAELERRLASMSTELGAARARIKEDERHIELLRGQLADAEARADMAGVRLAGASDPALARDTEITRLTSELATLRADYARAEHDRAEAQALADSLLASAASSATAPDAPPSGVPVGLPAANGAPAGTNGVNGPGRPAHEAAVVEALLSRAELQAAEQAARELAAAMRRDA